MSQIASLVALALIGSTFYSPSAEAWGRRGHAAVAVVAADLAAVQKPEAAFLKDRAFDLGYYSNVPDLIWKKSDTYAIEWFQHFMDLEIFEREIKSSKNKVSIPYALDRDTFTKTYPEIPSDAGRSWWRIRELTEQLDGMTRTLSQKDLSVEKRHQMQADWLVTAGAIAHYIGDMAQPLHCTENYDGQLSGQKGIHAFFEDEMVDKFPAGELEAAVGRTAESLRSSFESKYGKMSTFELIEALTYDSSRELPGLLKLDKKIGRGDRKKAYTAYRQLIIDRMALGSLFLAKVLSRAANFPYNGEKFFTFVSTPQYIRPAPGDVLPIEAKGK